MKLEISIRVKVEKTEDLQKRIDLLMECLNRELWSIFGNIMRIDDQPPVTVAWSEVDN